MRLKVQSGPFFNHGKDNDSSKLVFYKIVSPLDFSTEQPTREQCECPLSLPEPESFETVIPAGITNPLFLFLVCLSGKREDKTERQSL